MILDPFFGLGKIPQKFAVDTVPLNPSIGAGAKNRSAANMFILISGIFRTPKMEVR